MRENWITNSRCIQGQKQQISIKGILSLKIKLILNENLGKNIKIVLWHFRENSPYTEKIREKEKKFRGMSMEDEDVRPHVLVLHSLFSLWRTGTCGRGRTSSSSTGARPRPPGRGSSSVWGARPRPLKFFLFSRFSQYWGSFGENGKRQSSYFHLNFHLRST